MLPTTTLAFVDFVNVWCYVIIQHVERLEDTSEGPPDTHSVSGAVPALCENGRQLVTLRDDVCHTQHL